MNRNSVSPFGEFPGVRIPRSKISKPFTHKTTFNIGKLVPIYCSQILPGQTVEMDLNSFVRMNPAVTPTMDELICDTYFFFVPNRFLWQNWEKFLGANPDGSWTQTTSYVPPKLYAASSSNPIYDQNDAASYLGIYPANVRLVNETQTGYKSMSPLAMPLAAYCKCWNDWFRNENVEKEIPLSSIGLTGNDVRVTAMTNQFYSDIVMGYGLCPVTKTADVFTRSLPAPQKGDSVRIPVNPSLTGSDGLFRAGNNVEFRMGSQGTSSPWAPVLTSTTYNSGTLTNLSLGLNSLGTINDLRNAFAIQRMLEKDARGGTRYIELLKTHFNVSNGDLTLGRSEYLGGKRFGINMNQVVQNGGSADTQSPTPLGSVAGLSVTGDKSSMFTKSFTEHGWLIGCAVVRIKQHTYSQGINRQFFGNTRYDWYWPSLANVGEFAVYKKEIYMGDASSLTQNDAVFGYQEAWYQYRYNPNRLSGYMATQISGSLNTWHYGDLYAAAPSLNSTFTHEEQYQLDRTLAVTSATSHQFIADFFFNEKDVLPMPLYSVPGLIDHY